MHLKKKTISYFIIIAICYLYIVTIASSFGVGLDILGAGERRSTFLIFIVVIGALCIISNRMLSYNRIILSGMLLTIYMFFLGIRHNTDVMAWLSCSVLWFLVMLIAYNMKFGDEDMIPLSTIFVVTSIALSITYIYGTVRPGRISSVASSNSIYYVLGAAPFIFLTPVTWVQIAALCVSSAAIIISGKSTCFVALVLIWMIFALKYFGRKRISSSQLLLGVVAMVLVLYGLWRIARFYAYSHAGSNVFLELWDELTSGGNGRASIYASAWRAFLEANILRQIIGHGFNTVNQAINIGTHNDFLMVLYNYGMIGFALYLFFWVCLIQGFFQLKRESSTFTLAYEASLIVFFCISMASNVLNTQIQFLLLCMFWGICSPGTRIQHQSNNCEGDNR